MKYLRILTFVTAGVVVFTAYFAFVFLAMVFILSGASW